MQVNIALLTVTDTRTIDTDKSGAVLVKKIKEQNHKKVHRKIVKDEKEEIKKIILKWLEIKELDVILTTGGTGLTGRDITPEAIKEIADKEIPGFGEIFRYLSFKKIGTSSLQSRAIAGLAGETFIFALPGIMLPLLLKYQNTNIQRTIVFWLFGILPYFCITNVDRKE